MSDVIGWVAVSLAAWVVIGVVSAVMFCVIARRDPDGDSQAAARDQTEVGPASLGPAQEMSDAAD